MNTGEKVNKEVNMKDKEGRERVERILRTLEKVDGEQQAEIINLQRSIMDGVSVKDCPKCKHPVMAIESTYPEHTEYNSSGLPSVFTATAMYSCFQCLTCGIKFTCSREDVCKIVEE